VQSQASLSLGGNSRTRTRSPDELGWRPARHIEGVAESRQSGFADPRTDVPESIRGISGSHPVVPVWVNGDGGVTFRIGTGVALRFVKWAPDSSGIDLGCEAVRLRWASRYAKVPKVLDSGSSQDGTWLVTTAVAGESAITDRWKAQPADAVRIAGAALRDLHEALPVAECPFDWSIETRLNEARRTGASDDRFSAPAPPIDQLVVCHGDACVPNTLIDEAGRFSGHVDLGSLGVADRWADLAVGAWSTEWNYGPGWEDLYLASYGVEPDALRISYYRDLWHLAHPV
jgi:kanamycin kinase